MPTAYAASRPRPFREARKTKMRVMRETRAISRVIEVAGAGQCRSGRLASGRCQRAKKRPGTAGSVVSPLWRRGCNSPWRHRVDSRPIFGTGAIIEHDRGTPGPRDLERGRASLALEAPVVAAWYVLGESPFARDLPLSLLGGTLLLMGALAIAAITIIYI